MIDLAGLGPREASGGVLAPFRFREVGGRVLLTNLLGDWLFVSKDELAALWRGEVPPGSDLYARLADKRLVRDDGAAAALAERFHRRQSFLDRGPSLHTLVVTLRCNESCSYCPTSHVGLDAEGADMTAAIAEKAIDLALQSTSPAITIELTGGEPLANFPIVEHAVAYALERNRAYGKQLELAIASNLALLDEAKLAFLLARKVRIATTIDGPQAVHDGHRSLASGSAWGETARWVRRIHEEWAKLGLDPALYHVEARPTVTPALLPHAEALVDTYADLGCRSLFVRPTAPIGGSGAGAPLEAYLDFYRATLARVLDRCRAGAPMVERYAATFLTKILGGDEPGFVEVRSPSTSAIGQLAYGHDGGVYTSDEGRTLAAMGDAFFRIGDVRTATYRQLMTHETVRALTLASNLAAQPDCVACTYAPYCGMVPEQAYRTQHSIFGRMRDNELCAVHKAIQDHLFELLGSADDATLEILRGWTAPSERAHFVHAGTAS